MKQTLKDYEEEVVQLSKQGNSSEVIKKHLKENIILMLYPMVLESF